ncbi:hypothetical protein CBR_g55076 [Chara braunii]|uniref:Uncharacterized protein n=1 Tax=Chara braunii TaxID=69332 RepID=A0A388MCM1_CHABU|nr:hypothetical protein CBR_g55076 [Chara braunii]|eukprot:GBG92307.1 hypothetical protein CBR_g55076 [Chara braunii]
MVVLCQQGLQKEAELVLTLTVLLCLVLQLTRLPSPSRWLVRSSVALAGEAAADAITCAIEPVPASVDVAVAGLVVSSHQGVVASPVAPSGLPPPGTGVASAVAPLVVVIGGALVVVDASSVAAAVVGPLADTVAHAVLLDVVDVARACVVVVESTFVHHGTAAGVGVHTFLGQVGAAFADVALGLVVSSHQGVVASPVALSGLPPPGTIVASAVAVVFVIVLHGFAFAGMPRQLVVGVEFV